MASIVTTRAEIALCAQAFNRRISAASKAAKKMEWAFPNGERQHFKTLLLDTRYGELLVAIHNEWPGRKAHLFALDNQSGILAPDVEINVPEKLNRKVSGAYMKHGGNVTLCHRGGFTAFRGKIPKQVSHGHFAAWLVEAHDGEKTSEFISVASISSKTLADDIAEFVFSVSDMKRRFKSGETSLNDGASKYSWRESDEYEGLKSSGKGGDGAEYDYTHGPLCNSLRRFLERELSTASAFCVRSNRNIDVAIVEYQRNVAAAIFELKTSSSLRSQLFTAYGQLAYYRRRYGSDSTRLFLVLPDGQSLTAEALDLFHNGGIDLVYGDGTRFRLADGRSLSEILTSDICLTSDRNASRHAWGRT